ncbi:MAG: dipeptidyl carboxypeptidase II, partial [Massilia sp.]|nr:dipeptidyl carboxypeptidase II [Massilia sp.]
MLVLAAGFALVQSAFAAAPAPASAAAATLPASNPLASASTLPFEYPAFDKIKDEHFKPAYAAGMAEQLREVDAIANSRDAPSFENTIVAMEKSGRLLTRVATIFSSLQGANTNDALDAIDRDMSPRLAAHNDAIFLNTKLYQRVKALYDKRASLGLDPESAFLLERYNKDFVLAGANLNAADKKKLKAYNGQIAIMQTAFTQNVLKETNASALVVDTREELAGMTPAAIDAAAAEATKRKLDGKFVVPLMNTTGQPPLAVLTNRATREHLLAASMARGSHGGKFDNRNTVLKLAKLRAERAALLGYPNFASYSLVDQTAQNPANVNKLLAELAKPAVANARKEAGEIQKLIDAEKGGFKVAAHDWAFYTDKVRAARYAFDENQLKPYFELDSVL